MGSLTPRLGLFKPAVDDLVDVTVDLNNNYDKLDSLASPFNCTSGTRPTSPYNGMMIFETDTNRLLIRTDEGKWRTVTPRQFPVSSNAKTTNTLLSNTLPTGTSLLSTYQLCKLSGITGDSIVKFNIRMQWSGSFASSAPANTDAYVMAIYKAPAGSTTFSQADRLLYVSAGPGSGASAAVPTDGGYAELEFLPTAGSFDYWLCGYRTDGNKSFTITADVDSPTSMAIRELPGAEYV